MARGHIKWFNAEKGYGFIEQENGGPDVFVHYTDIKAKGYKTLHKGDRVEFEIVKEPKGLRATNVTKL